MESSILFPPMERPVLPQEPNSSINTASSSSTPHFPSTSAAALNNGGASSTKRYKPPQPPIFVPPGHVAFRLLCHSSRVGGLIGKSGSIIKRLQELTNTKIRIDDPSNSPDHRLITVIALPHVVKRIKLSKEVGEEGESDGNAVINDGRDEEWFEVSAGQEGIVRVFERVVEVAAEGDAMAAIGGMVSCRLVVGKNQGGAVIGKGGQVVEKIRRDTGCRIKVLVSEKLPSGSLPTDEIVEIEGDVLGVKKALVAVTSRLQEFPPIEKAKVYGTKPFEAEPLPVPSVDLPIQRSPMSQPMPSNSMNGNSSFSLDSDKVSNIESRAQQQEVGFMILCPNERVGGIIGKGGSIIKAIQSETGASIIIGPTVAECDERVITITATENVESQHSPAQNAAVLVFKRCMQAGDAKGLDLFSKGSPVSARVLVPLNHVGCLLGKGGAIISEMRKATGTSLRLFGGNQVPICAPDNVEVLQITGDIANVQDALYKVTQRLRDNIFSTKISIGSGYHNSLRTENNSINGRMRNPPSFGVHPSLGISDNPNDLIHSMGSLGISNNIDQSHSPGSLAQSTVNQSNAVDAGRRLPSVKGGVELGSGSRSAIVTNTTVEIVVPDNIFGSIYGENGNNLVRLRQISRAKVTVHEPRPGTTDRIVVISGTPDETQAAQSLLQAFILAGS